MSLDGKTVYFLGKLAASNREEAAKIVRRAGGKIARKLTPKVEVLVVGEGGSTPTDWSRWNEELDTLTRDAFEAGTLEIVPEADFWSRCHAEGDEAAGEAKARETLYTPSMLAETVGVPINAIRHLETRGFIVPVHHVHRLPYYDYESILPLKIVRSMLDAGLSLPRALDRLARMRRFLPHGQVDIRVRGKDVLFLTEAGPGPVNQDGQHCFSFLLESDFAGEAAPDLAEPEDVYAWGRGDALQVLESVFEPETETENTFSKEAICEAALHCENTLCLEEAAELYRTALALGGPDAQVNFQLAEVLYRLGDLSGARERYFMAIELDEEFVEARANLGCVLVEQGNDEWAAAAFRGALKHHPEYAEVHFHLGMLLNRVGLADEAREHLRIFLELAPDSPWADKIPPVEDPV